MSVRSHEADNVGEERSVIASRRRAVGSPCEMGQLIYLSARSMSHPKQSGVDGPAELLLRFHLAGR